MHTGVHETPEFASEAAAWVELLTRGTSASEVYCALMNEREARGSWWQTAEALAPVLEALGRKWEAGELTVLQEHLASERLVRGLARCSETLAPPDDAPQALLLASQGDEHTLGLALLELCLREGGWRPRMAGRRTPLDQVVEFVASGEVDMVAMSASGYSTDEPGLAAQADRIGAACAKHGAKLLLGGRGSWPDPPSFGHRLHSFEQLHELLERWR
jgi:methanogenic corrinoid protein MtbC1